MATALDHDDSSWALVVESNASLRRLTAAILRQQGCRVVEACAAIDAEEHYFNAPRPVDLAVIGFHLEGGGQGLTMALRWRETQANLRILVTGAFVPDAGTVSTMRQHRIQFLSLPSSYGRLSRALEADSRPTVRIPARELTTPGQRLGQAAAAVS